jgi:polysaccharide biosynthesis protein VpsQ
VRKWVAGLVILAVILIVIAADAGRLPKYLTVFYNFPFGDKLGHFSIMGLLAFVVNAALFPRDVNLFGRPFLLGTILIVVFVTLEEISQNFFPSRTADLIDLLASYLGIFFADWLCRRWKNPQVK